MICYVSTLPDGRLAITRLSPQLVILRDNYDSDDDFIGDSINAEVQQDRKLPKTMFELSRIDSLSEHFDPTIHTLEAIAAGIPGHFPLECFEMDDTTFPADRSRRNDWEKFGDTVRVKPDIPA